MVVFKGQQMCIPVEGLHCFSLEVMMDKKKIYSFKLDLQVSLIADAMMNCESVRGA